MNEKKTFALFAALIVFGAGAWYFAALPKESSADALALATCLRDKGITMYGADWCPHCQNEKRAFGKAFELIPYVECPDEPAKCLAAGIEGYPTWIFPDGTRLVGEQGIERLGAESGCDATLSP